MSYNNVGHLTGTIITLQHFAALHHTSPNYTSLHLSTLHFLSFTLHYPLIWLNPFTFPIVLFPLTSPNQTQYGYHIPKLISKIMNPFTALKNLSPFHFTFTTISFDTSFQSCRNLWICRLGVIYRQCVIVIHHVLFFQFGNYLTTCFRDSRQDEVAGAN